MQIYKTMKEETIEQMIDALAAEGRVRRLAQHDCADLPLWGRRRQRRADRLRYAAAACFLLAILTPATLRAHASGGLRCNTWADAAGMVTLSDYFLNIQ